MLQWYDGSWEHRAYWGANAIGFGVDGTNGRRFMGPLPATGQWVRLEVPASLVGLEGRTLNGMAFSLSQGRATWDHAGKGRHYDPASTRTVSVDVVTVDREAVAPADYQAVSTTLTFAPGEIAKTVTVDVVGEKLEEPDETFLVRLQHPVNAALARGEAVGTILDDDVFTIDAVDVYLVESKPQALLKLQLNRASEDAVSVRVATADDVAVNGQDYSSVAQTVTFAPGSREQVVPLPLLDDAVQEGPERFWVDLSEPAGAHLARARVGVYLLDDEKPASYLLATTIRDFKYPHPDIHNCGSVPRPAVILGADGKLAYGSGGTGAANFGQWYRDTPGVNLKADYDINFTKNGANFEYLQSSNFFPIDGKLYGNEGGGSRNFQFTTEMHAWFTYEPGATFFFGSDDDGWCFVNNQLAIDRAACHGFSAVSLTLSNIAATFGLVQGESYRVDCFQAERGQGVSGFYVQTPLYLQQFDAGTLQIEPTDLLAAEGTNAALQVKRLGGAFGTVQAALATSGGTATPGADYTPLDTTVSFAHADRAAKNVTLPILDDVATEPDETVDVAITSAAPASSLTAFSRSTVTIADDESLPVPELYPATVPEGSRGEEVLLVGLRLAGENRHGATVNFATVDGTAIAGSDYRATSGTLQFAPGQTLKYLEISVIGDTQSEGDEWLELALSGSGYRPVGNLRLQLADDDRCGAAAVIVNGDFEQPVVAGQPPGWTAVYGTWANYSSWSALNVYASNSPGGEIYQDVDLSGFAQFIDRGQQRFAFRVDLATWGAEVPSDTGRYVLELRDQSKATVLASFDSQEATKGTNWAVLSTVMTAPPNSRWARVRLINKRYTGADTNAHFDRATLLGLAVPSLVAADATFNEGQAGPTAANIPVSMTCAATGAVSFDYATADGTARAGQDYDTGIGTITIPAGSTATTIPLRVLGDTVSEGNETFFVRLEGSQGAVVPRPQLVVTIVDDETRLSIANGSKNEGDEGGSLLQLTVTLDKAISLPVTVDYATEDYSALAGEDYVATSGTLTFAPNETAKTVAVEILGDRKVEPDEELFVVLSNPNNAAIAQGRASAKIKQDDIEISISDVQLSEGNSGQRDAVFDVRLSAASTQTVTVVYQTVDLLAVAGQDYLSRSGTLSIPAGTTLTTIKVPVLGDTVAEGSETFTLRLSQPTNAALGRAEATGFILDDDDCPSVNLLANPGGEQVTSGEITYWREVQGTTWGIRTSSPSPFEGGSYFAAGSDANAELAQDVDVSAFASWIDAGLQRFSFEGYLRSGGSPPDQARIVVEYRDAANGTALTSYDSGAFIDDTTWRYVSDLSVAPAGTRWIRVRLIGVRQRPSGFNFAFFDALSLRSLGTPIVLLPDREIVEGDESNVTLPYDLRLSCASGRQVSLSFTTVDGSARAGSDYAATAGALTYTPGESTKTVPILTYGDFLNEIRETFRLEITDVVNAVVLDRDATITLSDADLGTPVRGTTRIYTLDQDFDLGFTVGLNHDGPHDQLQLDAQGGTFPFLWVAASARGTILKIDTRSGQILGELSTNPDNRPYPDPSRTTVSFDGSVWVGNRGESSVVHVGLAELGQCIDRNGNGTIETSTGYGNVRPWPNALGADTNGGVSTAADECILNYVKVRMSIPRHVSVDRDGNIWVGGYAGACSSCFDYLDGRTGATLRQVNMPCGGYGGFIDGKGILWSSNLGGVLRWDPAQPTSSARCLDVPGAYGVAVGGDGNVYANDHTNNRIWKLAPDGTVLTSFPRGSGCGQGLAVDAGEHIWSSSSRWCSGTQISHVRGDGTFIGTLDNVPTGSTGIAVDDVGKIWAASDQANKVFRIDPTKGPIGADGASRVGEVDLVIDIPGANAYNYSDMTGFQALRHTLRQGSWSTIQDAGLAGAEWGVVSWNTEPQASLPAGSAILVEVRTAEKVSALGGASWQTVTSGVRFQRFGRYLQVRVTERLGTATVSPVLSDLRIGIEEPEVRVSDVTVSEGNSGTTPAAFVVTLSEAVGHSVTLGYRTVGVSATAGVDFTDTTGTIVVPPGTTTVTIPVPVIGDTVDEDDETFTLELTSALGGKLVDASGEGHILDDDTRVQVTATKVAALADDRDGNGVVTPGDVLEYTIAIQNVSGGALAAPTFDDTAPAGTQIVPGSVTTSAGSVESESPLRVALGAMAADATATIRFRVELAVPWTAGAAVVNQGRVSGLPTPPVLTDDPALPGAEDPTVTAVAAVPVLAASKSDELLTDVDGDGRPSPGDVVRYRLTITNTGTVAATQAVLQDVAPANTSMVAGSAVTSQGTVASESPLRVELGTLVPDARITVSFAVRVDLPVATGVEEISNQASLTSAELPAVLSDDPDVPGRQDSTVTAIAAAPKLVASKTDELAVDADGDHRASPGDTLAYGVRVRNNGNTAATGVAIADSIPENTTLVPGSVTLSAGTLRGVDPIAADIGEIAAGAEVVLAFRVRIVSPVEPWVREVVNQAAVTSAELPELRSDDPDLPGVADPTATPVAAAPVLALAKTDTLYTDPNNDGYASPGEMVLYQLTLANTGNTAATVVALTDALPPLATLEPGTVQTSQGTVRSQEPIEVALGTVAAGATATVSFRVRIADPFPAGESELVNQASVTAEELAALGSDDPSTPEPLDPTRTPVIRLVDVTVGDVSVAESAGSAVFPLTLSAPSSVPVSVAYSLASGSATAGVDFTAASGTLTIPAGQTQGTIEVPVLPDTLDEPDETFLLTLASPAGARLADSEAVGTIVDDDAPPALAIGDVTVTEGDAGTTTATFTLTLSAPSAFTVEVAYTTAPATADGTDFRAASGTVSFAPGEVARTVSVDVLGDLLDEDDETFTLRLGDPRQVVLARDAGTGTILDDDAPPALTVADVTVDEGNSGNVEARFAVSLSAPSGREVRVTFTTVGVEATAGADFQAVAGELVLPAGATTGVVAVPAIGDLLDEPDERFELRLASEVNVTLADAIAVGTIRDDDAPPELSIGDVSVHEGNTGFTTIEVPLRLSAASGQVVSVAFSTADGTAITPDDYLSTGDTLLIPAATTQAVIAVQVRGDTSVEPDETLRVRLANAMNATLVDGEGVVTIIDDDQAPVTTVSIGDVTVTEGDSGTRPATFAVTLAAPSTSETRVRYATAAGTATAGDDYVSTSGELVFAPGTTSRNVEVAVKGDLLLEEGETFEVRLSDPVGLTLGDAVGTGTIVDDETCQGPELVVNGGAETRSSGTALAGWKASAGTTWTRVSTPAAQAGGWSFSAPVAATSELSQDVDLRVFAARTTGGTLRFALRGSVLAQGAAGSASGRIVLELRSEANTTVLATQDLGEVEPGGGWSSQLQVVTAPAGTGWARLRLVARRTQAAAGVYFDGVSLHSLRVPVVTVADMATYEGDSGQHDGVFELLLACPIAGAVTTHYATADGTATAGADYLARSGDATFAAGETEKPVPVPVLGDELYEGHERFTLELSGVTGGDAVLLDPTAEGLILDDDFCPRSPGYWKTHSQWPVTYLVLGGREYDKNQALTLLGYSGSDAATHLARQLVATKLNLLVGGDPYIVPAVDQADAFLARFPPGSNPKGGDRDEANRIKALLEAYNTTACTGVTPKW
ncbi:MAG TPA: Calx-beta domain-containing protein [Thermoanaerobaculia bacterium]|nr:Calx-beta domain-containing protein [Thermoanaerobaculia bacterium]